MKRVTNLFGEGYSGKISISIKTDSKNEGLTAAEHKKHHNRLVESIFKSLADQGCWSQDIKVK